MSDILAPGRKDAKKAQKEQEQLLAMQKQKEDVRLAESESEVARRRALTQRPGGRSLLTATSPTGVNTLGGTNA